VLTKRTKIKIFEKKPKKGGTPAIEKRIKVTTIRKREFDFKSPNELMVVILKDAN
jgi:hypothetical protein